MIRVEHVHLAFRPPARAGLLDGPLRATFRPMHSPPILVAVAVMLAETLVLFAKPQWLARLAFVRLARERRFDVREPTLGADAVVGFRGRSESDPVVAALPARTDLDDAVLFSDATGRSFALRRAYGLGRRQIWLVRIDLATEGRQVLLHTTQAFVPITFPVFLVALMMDGRFPLAAALLAIGIAVVVGVLGQFVFVSARDAAIEAAFDEIEQTLKRG